MFAYANVKSFEEADVVSKGVYGQLHEIGVMPEFDQLNDVIDYCCNNTNKIFDKLEPNVVVEFRHSYSA